MKTIAKGGAVGMGGLVARTALSIAIIPVITRILGADGYGLYALSTRMLEALALVLHFGFISSIARFVAVYEGNRQREHTDGVIAGTSVIALLAATAVSAVIALFPEWVSIGIYEKPLLTPVVRIAVIALPMLVVSQILGQATIAKGTVFYFTLSELVVDPVKLAGVLIFTVFAGWGVVGAAYSIPLYTAARLVAAGAGIFLLFRGLKLSNIKHFEFGRVFLYSLPLMVAVLASFTVFQAAPLIGALWIDNAGIGIYAAVSSLFMIGMAGLTSVMNVFSPIMADLYSRGEMEKLDLTCQTTTRWIYHITMMPLLFLTLKSGSVVRLFGVEFGAGGTVVVILGICFMGRVAGSYSGSLLSIADRPWLTMVNNVAITAINFALCFALVPKHGLNGLALATGISTALGGLVPAAQTWWIFKLHPFKSRAVKPALALALAAPALLVIRLDPWWLDIIAAGAAFSILYAALARFLCYEPEDRVIVDAAMRKIGLSRNPGGG
ncbi:MAG: oligosaccharide flippase family protein [bacterium]